MSNTIILKGRPIEKEGIASGTITPGYLVEFGGSNDLQAHSTAGGNARKAFALENDQVGNDIDDDYSAADSVRYAVCSSGDEIYALVAASATAITKGAPLESAGDGTLRLHTPPSQAVDEGGSATYTISQKHDAIVAYALEAVDNSAGATEARIKVEVA